MKKVAKSLLSALLTVVMVVSAITIAPVKAEAATAAGTVTFTIERMTIGQGFYLQPTQIAIDSDDTVKDVFERAMDSISGAYKASSDWGFYLTGIYGADTYKINIPDEISSMPEYTYTYVGDDELEHVGKYSVPNNITNNGNSDNYLDAYDYSEMSGWMFTINNKSATASADQIKVKNGDVIRLQYTLYGYGADLGYDTSSFTGIPQLKLANKDELLKAVAAVNAKKAYWMAYSNVKTAYNNAVYIATSYNPTQEKVNEALNSLRTAEKSPLKPTVKRAKISKLKNVKGKKVKITVKKMSGVTGFQYKYANNKKFKKAVKKITTKGTLTTKKIKKLKKNKKCYVKVRAYIKVNGEKVYGAWSKTKSIKIKK